MFLKYCSASTTPSAGEGGPCAFATAAALNASAAQTVNATPSVPRVMSQNLSTNPTGFLVRATSVSGALFGITIPEQTEAGNPMRGVRRAWFIVLSVFLFHGLFLTSSAGAQIATAELNGRVTDESGAILPGATVTVTQTATGLVRTVVTDSNGAYLLSNLPTGPYRLEVMLQGFRAYVQTGIVLQVGATPTINAVLALGSLEESITCLLYTSDAADE